MPVVAVIEAAVDWIAVTVASATGSLEIGGDILAAGDAIAGAAGTLTFANGIFQGLEAWSLVAGLAGLGANRPKLGAGGNPTDFKADMLAPVPYVIGRTGTAGYIVAEFTSDDAQNNDLNFITVLSAGGPCKGIEAFTSNNFPVVFDVAGAKFRGGYQATIAYAVGDGVTFLGADYVCTQACTNISPLNGSYWSSTPGFAGGTGLVIKDSLNVRTYWQANTQYNVNDGVTEGANDYICVQACENIPPPAEGYWAQVPLFGNNGSPGYAGGWMYMWTRLGQEPETPILLPSYFAANKVTTNDWTAKNVLSGFCHARWMLHYNTDVYPTGVPKPLWTVYGPLCYDPRLDSTYPGGSGPHRSNDKTTWSFSENPYIHALQWCLGQTSNGIRILGLGAPIAAIDVAAFVAGANVADANGWKVGGVVSSADSKWQVLVGMLQAGCGVPLQLGAMISCVVNTPRVSLATLTGADVIGEATIAGTQPRRDRVNTIHPRYRSEPNGWQMVAGNAVQIGQYVTVDGEQRAKGVDYPLVQNATQAAQLSAYAIYDAREFAPISLPLKPKWLGLQPGDLVTVNEPGFGLTNQPVLILDRKRDPGNMTCLITGRSETPGKHAAALGQTTVIPPTPTLSAAPNTAGPPIAGSWAASGTVVQGESGKAGILTVTGAVDDPRAANVIVDYRLQTSTVPSYDVGVFQYALDSNGGFMLDSNGAPIGAYQQLLNPGTFGPWTHFTAPATATSIPINVGAVGVYQVRVRYRSVLGAENPYQYLDLGLIQVGSPLTAALPNVTGLNTVYNAGILNLVWNAVSDFRNPDYEIRVGSAWAVARFIGRVSNPGCISVGDGTYWIAAHYTVPNGSGEVYSASPASIVLAGSQLTTNVIASHDQAAEGWTGSLTNVSIAGADIKLNAGNSSGSYQVPTADRVNVGRVCANNVVISVTAFGQASTDNLLTSPDMLAIADLTGGDLGGFITVTPQIRLSQDGTTWGAWQNWTPGAYVAMAYDFQLLLTSDAANVVAVVTAFTVAVDVPDLVYQFTSQAIASGGTALTYTAAFNGGPGGASLPNVQVTIVNGSPGDVLVFSSETKAGFTLQITNGGVGVARTVNIVAQGY